MDTSCLYLEVPDYVTKRSSHSDEEVILASSRPKKRAGRKKFKETRHPVYRGVRRRNSNKWVCELREPNNQKRIWLGTYPTAEMAARAHDVAALALRGTESAVCLNFADSVWRSALPVSKDAKDIRKAAVQAAEAFRPSEQCDKIVFETESNQTESYLTSCGGLSDVQPMHDIGKASDHALSNSDVKTDEANTIFDEFLRTNDGAMFELDLAEGLLYSPPHSFGVQDSFRWDDIESDAEVSLWSFSF